MYTYIYIYLHTYIHMCLLSCNFFYVYILTYIHTHVPIVLYFFYFFSGRVYPPAGLVVTHPVEGQLLEFAPHSSPVGTALSYLNALV